MKYAKSNKLNPPPTPQNLTSRFVNEYNKWSAIVEKEYTILLGNALVETLGFANFFLKPIESFDKDINEAFNNHKNKKQYHKNIRQPQFDRPLPQAVQKDQGKS